MSYEKEVKKSEDKTSKKSNNKPPKPKTIPNVTRKFNNDGKVSD